MNNPNNNRSLLFGVVGGYLIYLAYQLMKDMIDDIPSTMPKWLIIVVSVLFAAIGVTLLVFAWKMWKKGREEPEEGRVEIDEETGEKPNDPAPAEEAGEESAKTDQDGPEK